MILPKLVKLSVISNYKKVSSAFLGSVVKRYRIESDMTKAASEGTGRDWGVRRFVSGRMKADKLKSRLVTASV